MFSGVPAGAPCAGNTKNNRNRTTNKDLFDFMKIFLGLNQRAARDTSGVQMSVTGGAALNWSSAVVALHRGDSAFVSSSATTALR